MRKLESRRVARRCVGVWACVCAALFVVWVKYVLRKERRGVVVRGCGCGEQVSYEQAIRRVRHLAFEWLVAIHAVLSGVQWASRDRCWAFLCKGCVE